MGNNIFSAAKREQYDDSKGSKPNGGIGAGKGSYIRAFSNTRGGNAAAAARETGVVGATGTLTRLRSMPHTSPLFGPPTPA